MSAPITLAHNKGSGPISSLISIEDQSAHRSGEATLQAAGLHSPQVTPSISPEGFDCLSCYRVQSKEASTLTRRKAAGGGAALKTTLQDQILYQGDFLRLWQRVADQTVDLVLTDPPFGSITQAQSWDVRPDFHVLGWIFANLIKPNGQVAIFSDFLTATEIESGFSRYFDFRFNWVWQKPSVIPANRSRPANDIELILVYKVKGARIKDVTFNIDDIRQEGKPYERPAGKTQNDNPARRQGGNLPDVFVNESGKRFPRSVLHFPNKPCMEKSERTPHPTQKPIALLECILRGLSNSGDTILDPFTGSGSTLVACHRLGRQGLGFELAPEYFDMAKIRLERETAQGVLL